VSRSRTRASESVGSLSNYSEVSEEEACVFAPGSPTGSQGKDLMRMKQLRQQSNLSTLNEFRSIDQRLEDASAPASCQPNAPLPTVPLEPSVRERSEERPHESDPPVEEREIEDYMSALIMGQKTRSVAEPPPRHKAAARQEYASHNQGAHHAPCSDQSNRLGGIWDLGSRHQEAEPARPNQIPSPHAAPYGTTYHSGASCLAEWRSRQRNGIGSGGSGRGEQRASFLPAAAGISIHGGPSDEAYAAPPSNKFSNLEAWRARKQN